jgi:transposase-like protein
VYTIEAASPKPGRHRRTHGAQFKAQAIASCQPPGVSVSAVALSYGINANLLRRWILAAQTSPTRDSMPETNLRFSMDIYFY